MSKQGKKRWVTYPGHKNPGVSVLPAKLQKNMEAHINSVYEKKKEHSGAIPTGFQP